MSKLHYNVAGHIFTIEHKQKVTEGMLPSFEPFKIKSAKNPLFHITVDNDLMPCWQGQRVGHFPCNIANFEVYRQNPMTYQILILDESNIPTAFMQGDVNDYTKLTVALRGPESMAAFGLNNAMMLAYTFFTAPHKTLLMHSSVVEKDGKGYMFLGASGKGKSTHSDLWVKHIEGATLINDDNPVVRIDENGTPIVYGSPWSGKRPIYKNVQYPIGGITAIEQKKQNSIRKEDTPTAFGIMLSSCSTMKFDKRVHLAISGTIGDLLGKLPIYTLSCLPNEDAAKLSSETLIGNE